MKFRNRLLCAVTMFGLGLGFLPASAETLKLALAQEHQSVDPHFSRTSPNRNTAEQIFEALVTIDENMQMQPQLAESWTAVDDLTWEIKLRPDVLFHDGTAFDAADVISSVNRIPNVENSPASFVSAVASIESMEAVDDHTLLIKTKEPTPNLMELVGSVYIIPSELGVSIKSADFDAGSAAIGTGPYSFVSWTPNESLVLKRHDQYWGNAPSYSDVVVRYIPNSTARVATLIAGDVDAIDKVPPSDISAIERRGGLKLANSVSGRVIYLHLDSDRDVTPHITGPEGEEIKNPLKDARVRKALSMMIDRFLISTRIMQGAATPTGQMVPEGFSGFNPDIAAPEADLAAAKKLLAEAGYPDGFSVTIHGPNDRYVNDAKVIQAISQLFARGGLKSKVEAMPKNIYFKSASKRDFSVFLVGFGTSSGNSGRGLLQVLGTYDKEAGKGTFNRGRFSNPEFDAVMAEAVTSFDDARREELLRQAAEIAFTDEQGIIPLYFEKLIWATRDGIDFDTRPVERTLAQSFHPQG
ncbi:MAG: ABC transporter substrate-binding protein [Roseibium sp.]|uniref:ABC transporter substrate-binding protein n=1 Tax=Roseibium sp. TaxID=1936156 RepID=UPI00262FC96F|nr:ABC transporter substrate-binding protein [Roseibium sp.]MCV0426162.1 ABC transporter substrate-binding protein [Roseibium sp.]